MSILFLKKAPNRAILHLESKHFPAEGAYPCEFCDKVAPKLLIECTSLPIIEDGKNENVGKSSNLDQLRKNYKSFKGMNYKGF